MRLLFTIFLAAITVLAAAQTTDTHSRFIKVRGEAELEIEPNVIVLSIQLSEYTVAGNRVKSLEEIDSDFLKVVDASGLDEDDIVVSRVSSSAYQTKRKRNVYDTKTYEITFKGHKRLLDFTGRLGDVDINHMYITRLTHSDIDQLNIELKKQAFQNAKIKARELVEHAGDELGWVISIEETGTDFFYADQTRMARMAMEQAPAGLSPDDIGFKKLKFKQELIVRFQIK